jgi:hypothetical protein
MRRELAKFLLAAQSDSPEIEGAILHSPAGTWAAFLID